MRQNQMDWRRFRPDSRMPAGGLGFLIPYNHDPRAPRDRRLARISGAHASDISRPNGECATRPNQAIDCAYRDFANAIPDALRQFGPRGSWGIRPSAPTFSPFSYAPGKPRCSRRRTENAPRVQIWLRAALLEILRGPRRAGRRPEPPDFGTHRTELRVNADSRTFGRAPLNLAPSIARARQPNPTVRWNSRYFANARANGT